MEMRRSYSQSSGRRTPVVQISQTFSDSHTTQNAVFAIARLVLSSSLSLAQLCTSVWIEKYSLMRFFAMRENENSGMSALFRGSTEDDGQQISMSERLYLQDRLFGSTIWMPFSSISG